MKLITDQELVLDWLTGSYQVNLLKTGKDCSKLVNVNQGLKVNQIITFSPAQMFFAALFCVYGNTNKSLSLDRSKIRLEEDSTPTKATLENSLISTCGTESCTQVKYQACPSHVSRGRGTVME